MGSGPVGDDVHYYRESGPQRQHGGLLGRLEWYLKDLGGPRSQLGEPQMEVGGPQSQLVSLRALDLAGRPGDGEKRNNKSVSGM